MLKGKRESYSLLEATDSVVSWIAALEKEDGTSQPIDRYLVDIDKILQKAQTPMLIKLSGNIKLREVVLAATDNHLKASSWFINRAPTIFYKFTIEEDPHIQYVVQLHHHGNITSMNLVISLISTTVDPSILPLSAVYPIPGEKQRQKITGFDRQIARLISGPIANSVYPQISHQENLVFVQNMAPVFQGIWHIPLPKPRLIGELCTTQTGNYITLNLSPDRYYNFKGPFTSVRDYFRSHICSA